MAFDFAEEVMNLPLNPADKNFAKILAVKQSVSSSILTATTRTRPGDLRNREADGLDDFLTELKSGRAPMVLTEDDLFA